MAPKKVEAELKHMEQSLAMQKTAKYMRQALSSQLQESNSKAEEWIAGLGESQRAKLEHLARLAVPKCCPIPDDWDLASSKILRAFAQEVVSNFPQAKRLGNFDPRLREIYAEWLEFTTPQTELPF